MINKKIKILTCFVLKSMKIRGIIDYLYLLMIVFLLIFKKYQNTIVLKDNFIV